MWFQRPEMSGVTDLIKDGDDVDDDDDDDDDDNDDYDGIILY